MATVLPVQRNAITPVPPMSLEGDMGLLSKWLPQLLNVTYKTRLDTQVSAVPTCHKHPLRDVAEEQGPMARHMRDRSSH